MGEYKIKLAQEDWIQFIEIFNRCTIYAPYSIPLSEILIRNYIEPFGKFHEDYAIIADNGIEQGIMHIGKEKYLGSGRFSDVGVVYLLIADNNAIAQHLLERAEAWFAARELKLILAYWWYPNPYKFILHGSEVYGWAGAYPTINAFRRQQFDIALDILVMLKDLSVKPEIYISEIRNLELIITEEEENDLAFTGRIVACIEGMTVGYCGYQYLKAISEKLGKGLGQINIGANSEFHGHGVGKTLITYAHSQLFKKGSRQVILATNQSLFRAIKFYEKLGYRSEPIHAYAFTKGL